MNRGEALLHLSVHTFTPTLRGRRRQTDIGILFDPTRKNERIFCERLKKTFKRAMPGCVIRFNDPYRGYDDALVTHLRLHFPAPHYLGVAVEVNQKFVRGPRMRWRLIQAALTASLKKTVGSFRVPSNGRIAGLDSKPKSSTGGTRR